MRVVLCVNCRKRIQEGSMAIRSKYRTGFYCGIECFLLSEYTLGGEKPVKVEVTDELVHEDKKITGYGWWGEEPDKSIIDETETVKWRNEEQEEIDRLNNEMGLGIFM